MNVEPTSQDSKSLIKKALIKLGETEAKLERLERERSEPIAVVGIGCRYPGGVTDPDSFWRMLCEGVDAIGRVPADHWDMAGLEELTEQEKTTIATGGFIPGAAEFDADFFGVTPREAQSMDPQQRLALEVAWEALEDANISATSSEKSKSGVFLGVCTGDYQFLLKNRGVEHQDAYLAVGTAPCVAAGRISHFLNWSGPSMAVDTACSSSLVSVHLAVQSLRLGESDLALAGGVNRILSPEFSVNFARAGMLAPDGRCKTFDASANGFVRAEGCGIVVLKRLSDANRDGNHILAIIRGSAVNQDGRTSGITVPNGPAQQKVIREALKNSRIEASQVDYVECHGTGTSLGDPIEVEALQAVYGSGRTTPLMIGSVKTNIGHSEAAAGIAGFIKAVLMLHRESMAGHLHFKTPNPLIRWSELGMTVCDRAQAWSRGGSVRRAGVSSFGFSGTNSHIILEEAPGVIRPESVQPHGQGVLCLSAKGEPALRALAARYLKWLQANPTLDWHSVCATAYRGRSHLKVRLAIVAESIHGAKERLQQFLEKGMGPHIFSSMHRGPSGAAEDIATYFVQQKEMDAGIFNGSTNSLNLPKYPFQRETFWFSPISKAQRQPATGYIPTLRAVMDELSISDETSPEEKSLLSKILSKLKQRDVDQAGWFYRVEWRKALNWNLPVALPTEWPAHFTRDASSVLLTDKPGSADIVKWFESTALDFVLRAFVTLGLDYNKGTRFTFAEIASKGMIIAKHGVLLKRCLEILVEERFLIPTQEGWEVSTKLQFLPGAIQPGFNGSLSEYSVELALLNRCGKGLAEVLTGRVDPLQMLFPTTGLGVTELYLKSASLTPGTELLVDAVRRIADSVPLGQGLRILEIGAGTGAVAAALLSHFGSGVEYWFTDISPTLVSRAKERFLNFPSVIFAVLNLEQAPEDQGVDVGFFDLVVASNVVHATTNLESSLLKIKNLLKPSGVICLQESTKPRRWSDLIFGMTEGWWKFNDREVRPNHPLVSPIQWNTLLGKAGFEKALFANESNENLAPQTVLVSKVEKKTGPARTWVIVGESADTRTISESITREGEHSICVTQTEAWPQFFAKSARAGVSIAGVVWLSVKPNLTACAEQMDECCRLLDTVKAWSRQQIDNPIAFLVVTQQAVVVGQEPCFPNLVIGFVRALLTEAIPLKVRVLDLPEMVGVQDRCQLIKSQLFYEADFSQSAIRGGISWTPRLVRWNEKAAERNLFSSTGTYLITGGCGFLGLRLAEWLGQQGVKSIALAGKSGASSQAAEIVISRLKASGVMVAVFQMDIGDPSSVEALFASLDLSMPVLRGVFHLAGVNEFDDMGEITRDKFHRVAAPKVMGAWNLHVATRERALDLFVSFSSGSSIWGAQKQLHYAAANSYLDSLTHYRRAQGLPGLSINWGLLAADEDEQSGQGFNMQERLGYQLWLGKLGMTGMNPAEGFDKMRVALCADECQITIANVNWKLFREVYEARGNRDFLSELRTTHATRQETPTHPSIQDILRSEKSNRKSQIQRWLKIELGSVMALEKWETLDANQGFFDMGLDSLMAVQLKNNLEKTSGLQLPGTLAFDYPSVNKLAQFMGDRLFKSTNETDPVTSSPVESLAILDADVGEIEKELAELDKLLGKGF